MSRRSTRAVKLGHAAPVFAALGDQTQLALVGRLCADGPLSIKQRAAVSAATRQAVTKHLDVLAQAGLVRDVRRGRERIFQLETERLEVARRFLDQASERWDHALGRLRRFVEE